jgi:hypothetical protein
MTGSRVEGGRKLGGKMNTLKEETALQRSTKFKLLALI